MSLLIFTNYKFNEVIVPNMTFRKTFEKGSSDQCYDCDFILNDTLNRDKYRIIELLNSNKISTINKLKIIDDIQEKSYAINLQPDNLFIEWNFIH
jgi:glutathione synthase/RimK-type ligase-like ATP-grasp enzyme